MTLQIRAPANEPLGRPQTETGWLLLIVDEPTAGLDPAERVRFLNLLSELGQNSVVLLTAAAGLAWLWSSCH